MCDDCMEEDLKEVEERLSTFSQAALILSNKQLLLSRFQCQTCQAEYDFILNK